MRRVAVTGLGIICPIGNSTQEVVASLREGRSGITKAETYQRMGFRSQVEDLQFQPISHQKSR